jgi:cytochrome c oxidase subunit 2
MYGRQCRDPVIPPPSTVRVVAMQRRRSGREWGPGARTRAAFVGVLGVVALTACSGVAMNALDPQGPNARRSLGLFSISFWVAVVVSVVVLGLLAYALFHRRVERLSDRRIGTRFVVVGGLVVPSLVLLSFMVLTFVFLAGFQDEPSPRTRIEVTGHQFWWELYYPEANAVSANEIHIPAGEPVELVLRSDDVIHSLWVPELSGKLDLVPGRTNRLVIEADEPGTYRGQCAEYCGLQHARMGLLVIAQERGEYERWLQGIAEPAAVDDAQAFELFERNGCAGCHTIRGTGADGELGPDLTHVGSRRTIAAATLENERAKLAGWISDAQGVKPGALMPPIPTLSGEELLTLVDYLRSLR